jgi:hypothetical protein
MGIRAGRGAYMEERVRGPRVTRASVNPRGIGLRYIPNGVSLEVPSWGPALGQRIRVLHAATLPKPVTLSCSQVMLTNSVLFGNRRQGDQDRRSRGNKGIAGLPPEVVGPPGRYLTGLVEPCGALPRKCLFIY